MSELGLAGSSSPGAPQARAWFEGPRVFYGALILLLVVSTGLYVWSFDSFQIGTWVDDAVYVALAESIVKGEDYGQINAPDGILPALGPFGWPLILAPVYVALGGQFQCLRLVALFFTVANIVLIAVAWKQLGLPGPWMGMAVAALYALSPLTTNHARMVMSEAAFLFFALLVLIVTQALASDSRLRLRSAFALGTVWVFALYVRTIGVATVAASLIVLALRGKWAAISVTALTSVVIVALIVGGTAIDWHDLAGPDQYMDQFSDPAQMGLVARGYLALQEYASSYVRDSLIPFVGDPTVARVLGQAHLAALVLLAAAVVDLLLLIGYVLSMRERSVLSVHLLVPLYFGILLVWPIRYVRFLYGVVPFLYGFLLRGLEGVLRYAASVLRVAAKWRSRQSLVGVIVGMLLCALLIRSLMIDDSLTHVRDLSIGTDWIRQHTPADSVVIAESPTVIYLYSRRRTVDMPDDPGALAGAMRDRPVYLLIAPELKWSDSGRLERSTRTDSVLARADGGAWGAGLVFENRQAMVKVFRIGLGSRVQE